MVKKDASADVVLPAGWIRRSDGGAVSPDGRRYKQSGVQRAVKKHEGSPRDQILDRLITEMQIDDRVHDESWAFGEHRHCVKGRDGSVVSLEPPLGREDAWRVEIHFVENEAYVSARRTETRELEWQEFDEVKLREFLAELGITLL